jgi:signal transduction histidine kinase
MGVVIIFLSILLRGRVGRLTKTQWFENFRKQRSFFLFQSFVLLFCSLAIVFFIHNISNYYDLLRTECILTTCSPLAPAPPTTIKALSLYHLTPDSYSFFFVMIECLLAFIFYTAALIIFIKCKREFMGILTVLALVPYGTTFSSLVYMATEGISFFEHIPEALGAIGRMALFLFLLLFPNGRAVKRWVYSIFVPFALIQFLSFLLSGTVFDLLNWSNTARIIYYLVMIGTVIYSQIYHYKNISTSVHRQQTKWVVYGVIISLLGSVIVSGFFVYPVFATNPVSYIYLSALLYAFVAIIPLTLTFAILRHRLWDIDPLVNRTIVYGTLSLAIILLYSLLVIYFSRIFKTDDNFFISLLATAIVAILFAPIKEKLQLIVNRLMKGRHDDPYAVLKELGEHLIKPIDSDEMLKVVVTTIKNALRLPYVGIAIEVNGEETIAHSVGETIFDVHSYPIVHGGEQLGTLLLSSRSPEEAFTGDDQRLIEVLLRQSGPIVQNVTMTLGMKLLANNLQDSRERLVIAREAERLQIRRNLHDDLAPRLMSLAFNVAAAEQYVKKNPDKAIELLEDLRKVIRATVDEIRTMVHDLRPPTLDEFGLIGSIKARMDEVKQMSPSSFEVNLHAPKKMPGLPAAVEVAAYRIITEALINVIRHASATNCEIFLKINSSNELQLDVVDNGVGLPSKLKPANNGGIGLTSIRERAMELGGSCVFENLETGGTSVKAILPFSNEEELN